MAKRVMDRRALRAQAEAAERLESEQTGEAAAPASGEAPAEATVAKKAAKPKRAKTRTPKAPARMRIVWTVFNNSNQPVAKYEYPQRAEADAHAARLTTEKKITHFVMPVKEAME